MLDSSYIKDNVVLSVKYVGSKEMVMIKLFHKQINAGIGIMLNLSFSCFDLYLLPFRPFLIPGPLISYNLIGSLFKNPEVLSHLHRCLSYTLLTTETKTTHFVCGFFSRSQPKEIICAVHMGLIKAIGLRESLRKRLSYKDISPTNHKW